MGIGIGAILGGLGSGVSQGIAEQARLKSVAQEQQMNEYRLAAAKRQKDEADEMIAASQQPAAATAPAAAPDAAATPPAPADDAAPASTDTSDDTSGAPPTSFPTMEEHLVDHKTSPGPMNDFGQHEALVVSKAHPPAAAAPAPKVGISAALPGAPASAAGVPTAAPLPPAAAPTTSPAADAAKSAAQWKQTATAQAAVLRKYGKFKEADEMLKAADDEDVRNYARKWQLAYRNMVGGNTAVAAQQIAQLYNENIPDGRHVEVTPVKDGTFSVQQFDTKSGDAVGGPRNLGADDMTHILTSTLTPDKMVPILRQEGVEKAWAARDASNLERTRIQEDARSSRTDAVIAGQSANTDKKIAGAIQGIGMKLGAGAGKADAASDKLDAKTLNDNLKAGSTEVDKLTTKNKVTDPAARAAIGAATATAIRNGDDAATAANNAYSAYTDKQTSAAQEANDHVTALTSKNRGISSMGTSDEDYLKKNGDPEVVKAAAAMNPDAPFSVKNYRTAAQQKIAKGGTLGKSGVDNIAPAAKIAPDAAGSVSAAPTQETAPKPPRPPAGTPSGPAYATGTTAVSSKAPPDGTRGKKGGVMGTVINGKFVPDKA